MKQFLRAAIFLLSALLLWQLAAQYAAGTNPVQIDEERVTAVVLTRYHILSQEEVAQIALSDREEVLAFCKLWNQNWVTEIEPYSYLGFTGLVDLPAGGGDSLRVQFQYEDATSRYFSLTTEFLFDRGMDDADYDGCYFHTSIELVELIESLVSSDAALQGAGA